jgi:hypothetical protein
MADKPCVRQMLVDRTMRYAGQKRTTNNIGKTIPLEYNTKKTRGEPVIIHGQQVAECTQGTHIGVIQAPGKTNKLRVENAIAVSRRALYSLFGAGMHGRNGLNPKYTIHMWTVMVLPCLLSGAEVWTLTPTETVAGAGVGLLL